MITRPDTASSPIDGRRSSSAGDDTDAGGSGSGAGFGIGADAVIRPGGPFYVCRGVAPDVARYQRRG